MPSFRHYQCVFSFEFVFLCYIFMLNCPFYFLLLTNTFAICFTSNQDISTKGRIVAPKEKKIAPSSERIRGLPPNIWLRGPSVVHAHRQRHLCQFKRFVWLTIHDSRQHVALTDRHTDHATSVAIGRAYPVCARDAAS